jgi:hypothetical protein
MKESILLTRLCITHINELCFSSHTFKETSLMNGLRESMPGSVLKSQHKDGQQQMNDYGMELLVPLIGNMPMCLEQEKAQAELGRGLHMQNGDLDGLIMKFEQLVRHANYDVNQPLVLRIFTDALPHAMYEYIFKNVQPRDYEGWREASIQQQKVFVHMKSRLEQFNPRKNAPTGVNNWKGNNYNNNANRWRRPNIPNLLDPNAMDLSPGRARLAQAEDYEPGRNRY